MKEMKIDPSTVLFREDNPNRMDPEKLEALTEIISRLGFLQPILVRELDDGQFEIVDGHHRTRAAIANGMTLVDAKVIEVGDDAHEHADLLQISMNNLRGRLDLYDTGIALAGIIEAGIDPDLLLLTGFDKEEIEDLIAATAIDDNDVMGGATLPNEDDLIEKPPKPFRIEIEFETKEEFQEARKALKKAAGKNNPLSMGLLNLIGAQG